MGNPWAEPPAGLVNGPLTPSAPMEPAPAPMPVPPGKAPSPRPEAWQGLSGIGLQNGSRG